MKLLFDENISFRLVGLVREEYPGSRHVRDVGLLASDDGVVWNYAQAQQFVIVSKDSDFRDRSFVYGPPPKVVWLDVGNSGTDAIAGLLRSQRLLVQAFAENDVSALLILSVSENAI